MKKILIALMALYLLGACAEREQVLEQQPAGKRYQGKRDTNPWDNEPLAWSSGNWAKGDRASWESQIRVRQQRQNENQRIYQ